MGKKGEWASKTELNKKSSLNSSFCLVTFLYNHFNPQFKYIDSLPVFKKEPNSL